MAIEDGGESIPPGEGGTKEKIAGLDYFTIGKSLAQAGVSHGENSRAIGFYSTKDENTILGSLYSESERAEPTVKFLIAAEDFPTPDTAGILVYSIEVNEQNEFLDASLTPYDDTLGDYIKRQTDTVVLLNFERELSGGPDSEGESLLDSRLFVEDILRIRRDEVPQGVAEPFRSPGEIINKLQSGMRIKRQEREMIRRVPSPKLLRLFDGLLSSINIQTDNITPRT